MRPEHLRPAPLAERHDLERVHTPVYVSQVFDDDLDKNTRRRIGLPWSQALVTRCLASVGGTIAAARAALEDGVSGNLAGGTHHAFEDRGEGYCVFNDIAVAIRVLQAERRIRRCLVIDLDVHQGNGTAAIFEDDDSVFTYSMHGARNFPFKKTVSSLDVPLDDGMTDDEYLGMLEHHLPSIFSWADPDLVFYLAGVDPLEHDRIGRLRLTFEGMKTRDRWVLTECRDRQLPVALVMGGGYSRPVDASVQAHVGTYEVIRQVHGDRFT